MDPLTPAQRSELRARAHHLRPVVAIGNNGLTPAVLREIDLALKAHELVKLRVANDDRDERALLMQRICAELGGAPVQQLGKLLIVWRERPRAAPDAPRVARSAPRASSRPTHTDAGIAASAARRRGRAAGAVPPAGMPRAATRRRQRP